MSYSLTRVSVVRGPAVITINNGDGTTGDQYAFSQSDIKVEFGHSTFDVANSAFGVVDKRSKERMAKVSFTPVGSITANLVKIFWPYLQGTSSSATFQTGDSALKLATSADPYVIVTPRSGLAYKFYGAVVDKMPELVLAADKTQIGSISITCIGAQGADWDSANSLYSTTSNTSGADYANALSAANFSVSSIKTGPYVGTYGAAAIGSGATGVFSTNAGFTVSFNAQLNPVETDEFGLFDFTVGDIVASASCAPLDVSADQIAAIIPMQGSGASRGASLQSGINLLVDVPSGVTGTGLIYTTLTNATVFQTGWAFGIATQRIPQLTFQTVRQYSSGGLGVPATINIH